MQEVEDATEEIKKAYVDTKGKSTAREPEAKPSDENASEPHSSTKLETTKTHPSVDDIIKEPLSTDGISMMESDQVPQTEAANLTPEDIPQLQLPYSHHISLPNYS
ncbi:hypothetical protein L6452_18504 [Arctium lappa]|uniref:Uncharacterized protein n=1 Tax=Arctium lappa TaxID=4217 RepID=A0ACB9C6C5_ARCLA|nr:hypothetical protein L6452_18504 [Arctium lappa]